MPDHKVTVGNVELISLFDAHGDMDPLQVFPAGTPASTKEIWRNEYAEFLDADGSLVSAGHFPGTGFGRFVRQGNRRVWRVLS